MKPKVRVYSHDMHGVPIRIAVTVMPHLSALEAVIIFAGGVSAGMLYAACKIGKEMKADSPDAQFDEKGCWIFKRKEVNADD